MEMGVEDNGIMWMRLGHNVSYHGHRIVTLNRMCMLLVF